MTLRVAGRVVGQVEGGVFRTRREARIHLCEKFQAYGIQESALFELADRGVHTIELEEHLANGTVRLWSVPREDWARQGIRAVLRPQDGRQVFLPTRWLREHCTPFVVRHGNVPMRTAPAGAYGWGLYP